MQNRCCSDTGHESPRRSKGSRIGIFSALTLGERCILSPFDFVVPQRSTELDAFARNRIVSCDSRLFGIAILSSK